MSIPTSQFEPDEPDRLPPARRRRAQRLLTPFDDDERANAVDDLAQRTSPSFDFFLFSLLSAVILSLGLLLDLPAILLLGALTGPLMAPFVGVALGTVIGSVRFFTRSLIAFLIGSLLVFVVGVVSGFIPQAWPVASLEQAHILSQLSWSNFVVLAAGAIFTTVLMARSGSSSRLASVALTYSLSLPLLVAGFGLTSRTPHLWPDGLVVFGIHLAWGILLSALTLAIFGFRPLTIFGYTVSAAIALLAVVLMIGISSAGAAIGGQIALPTFTPTPTLTLTPTSSPTITPVPPTLTLTPTNTSTPTLTPTVTPTSTPTPLYALVRPEAGAVIRTEPGGTVVGSYLNGALLQVLPDEPILLGNDTWVKVRGTDGKEGWILQSLLITATPAPNW